jgi:hypothetical protein
MTKTFGKNCLNYLPAGSYRLDTNIVNLKMELLSHTTNFAGSFSDKRLEKRAAIITSALFKSKKSSIHGSTHCEAEQKGFYRFLENKKVTEEALIQEMTSRCTKNCKNRDVIILQDTSSFGFSTYFKNPDIENGLGFVGNKKGVGFLSHYSIVIDATTETMLGFSDIQLWHRKEDKANNTTQAYKKEPIEEKESYKWIKASSASKQNLIDANSITIIEDREGDIYEQFSSIPDAKTHVLIRSRDNRVLANGEKLYTALATAAALGSYKINVNGDIRKEKVTREALVEVRAIKVTIKKPNNLRSKKLPDSIGLYAVEVIEKNSTAKDRICWRLLTTHKVISYEEAVRIINLYKQRWFIEQFFRLLKKQGFRIEETQLEKGWNIRKLLLLQSNTVIRIMQLYLAYDREDSQPISEVFTAEEIECLKSIEQKEIKKTVQTNNHNNPNQLAWATWIIARLGGWKGNKKQRAAGPITIKSGLEKFEMMYAGWKLAREYT